MRSLEDRKSACVVGAEGTGEDRSGCVVLLRDTVQFSLWLSFYIKHLGSCRDDRGSQL